MTCDISNLDFESKHTKNLLKMNIKYHFKNDIELI